MCTNIEGYDLNSDNTSALGFEKLAELNSHNFRSADAAMQNCLI